MGANISTKLAALEEKALTAEAPGDWAGKEAKHVPKVTKSMKDGQETIVVEVPHEMKKEHWISQIWLRDQNNELAGYTKLKPTDKPILTVVLKEGMERVRAFESCNLHGVWAGSTVRVN